VMCLIEARARMKLKVELGQPRTVENAKLTR
jgi:hypothetical protein